MARKNQSTADDKRYPKLMQLSSEFLQSILNSLNDAVKIINSSTTQIILANSAASELYSITESDFEKININDARFSKEENFLRKQIDTLAKNEKAKNFHFISKTKSGDKRYFELLASKIANSDFVISITRDVTEQRIIERELLQKEKLASIGQVTSSFAHEIKNPLTGIRLGLGLIEKNEKTKQVIDSISNDVKRLDAILENLLGYAKVRERNKVKIDINALLEKSIFLLRTEAEAQEIELETDYSEILPAIRADEDELQQVIVNIVLNAIQAVENNGRIMLRTSNYSVNEIFGVMIEVEDDGCGIADADLHKINQLFFTTKANGSGLGLPMSQKIIREHNGSIVFESKEGLGTVVKIFLPIELMG